MRQQQALRQPENCRVFVAIGQKNKFFEISPDRCVDDAGRVKFAECWIFHALVNGARLQIADEDNRLIKS